MSFASSSIKDKTGKEFYIDSSQMRKCITICGRDDTDVILWLSPQDARALRDHLNIGLEYLGED